MNLFQHEQISRLNESELIVYNYVSSHLDEMLPFTAILISDV